MDSSIYIIIHSYLILHFCYCFVTVSGCYFLICLFLMLLQYILLKGWRTTPNSTECAYVDHNSSMTLYHLQPDQSPLQYNIGHSTPAHATLHIYCLLQQLGNSCTGELHQPNSRCLGRGSPSDHLGLANSRTKNSINQIAEPSVSCRFACNRARAVFPQLSIHNIKLHAVC